MCAFQYKCQMNILLSLLAFTALATVIETDTTNLRYSQPTSQQHISPQHQTSRFLSLVTVLHIICGSSLHCSPDDGHIDARNMLR
jgi:hypothetical protein